MDFKKLFRINIPKDGANSQIKTSEKISIKKGVKIDG